MIQNLFIQNYDTMNHSNYGFLASLSLSAKDVNMGSWSREVVWADGLPLHEVAELREVDVKSLM